MVAPTDELKARRAREVGAMLTACGAVRFGAFRLASGRTSDVYVDVKRAWTDPDRLELLGRALADRVGDAERLAGIELGAVPLLAATSLYSRRPYAVVRKAAKEHGTAQRIEGEVPPGARLLVIEDVVTTGGSVAETIRILREAGGVVTRVLCVVDREEGGRATLSELGVALDPIVTLSNLRGPRA
jgi:orotate phosphoribosyltransferase